MGKQQIAVTDPTELLSDLIGLQNGQQPKLTSASRTGEAPNCLHALATSIGGLDNNFDKLVQATIDFLIQTFDDFQRADQHLKNMTMRLGTGLDGTAGGSLNRPESIWYGTKADSSGNTTPQSHIEIIDGQEVVVSYWQDV